MRTPATPPFASGDDARVADAEVRAIYLGCVAYFCTHQVDVERGTVVHWVQESLMPGYTGTAQPCPFKRDSAGPTIEADSQDLHFLRRFRRVE
ncbi:MULTISPECIES: lipocalin-like domain-containing protein [Lysobacter]|uniref:Lipocalin-like domain-containing protein n=1 Tax=Lysobacter firmicutimachus TaxID=1792846 RepID=A0ABU8D8Y6_9GAMM|nr:lipocalin-like domain-containing protein [Lysobacter antibioticus]